MKRVWLPVVLVVVLGTGVIPAKETTFTYEGLKPGLVDDPAVSKYMGKLYGSDVVCWGPEIRNGGNGLGPDTYIWSRALSGGVIAIGFVCEPVQCFDFEGYVFKATPEADFTVKAYAGTWDAIKDIWKTVTPVYSQSWNAGTGPVSPAGPISLAQPVHVLLFSNAGKHDIGIDDLWVSPCPCPVIPAPGAFVLVGLGMSMVGWLRTRRYL